MTVYCPGDKEGTQELVAQLDTDVSWLRHRGFAAELDRRLLYGASAAELQEVRPSWRGHILHLRREHRLRVDEEPAGFWRIVGAQPEVVAPSPSVNAGSDEDFEDIVDLETEGEAQAVQPEGESRIRLTARALSALAEQNLLGNPLLKPAIGMLIRQASESNHWHICAHYRSADAAALIAQAPIQTAGQYQAFCRTNLRHEHVVPNSVIYRMLTEEDDKSIGTIEAILAEFCVRATITREEDAALNRAGFASRMPCEFDVEGHALYRNPMARYIHTGLFDGLEERGEQLWFPR
jgi:hypothetical protein